MNVHRYVRGLLIVGIAAGMVPYLGRAADGPAVEAPAFGSLRGVTLDPSGQPLALVRVAIHSMDGGVNRQVVSAGDGVFVADHLTPGPYLITAAAGGLASASAARVDVTQNQTASHNVILAAANAVPPAASAANRAPAAPIPIEEELAAMKERIAVLEAALKARTAPEPVPAAATPLTARAAEPSSPAQAPAASPAAGSPAGSPPAPAPAPAVPVIPEALQAPEATPGVDNFTPFAYGDFTWLNGSPRNHDTVLDTKYFTPEVRFDTHFMEDLNQPRDHTMGGATESFRSGEFQVEQISVGGDFHWQGVRGRILTMNGLFATTTPRNDGSAGVGQWDVRGAYKYVSEAYGGYHFNVNHGLNVDAGIFVSYIGLFSYYNFDNWTYQPSFVSSNTPWFFNGLRIQWFPTNKLKIEPWIVNGWQSYNKFNGHRGLGGQILWEPKEWLKVVLNNYGNGTDTLGNPGRSRLHTDDSVEVRYYNNPQSTGISKMAFSLTGDAGCEYGGGVTCHGGKGGPKQAFLGWMLYDRFWFHKDLLGLTLGGGMMNNPGRYLTLLPPINGADAVSGSPYFTANPGDKAHMWDSTITLQYMPKQYITWWTEAGYRHSDVPYWTGRGGITPPGGNTGAPGQYVCANGGSAGTSDLATAYTNCGGPGSVWFPDLRHGQMTFSVGVMVKF
ncbi:MAG TPA: TonB-dependent receptor [Candidatus Acidoferrales bacterium]|nr:TonB-dependent receptor [Candidatus Acidoferrales bacterium]